MVTLEDMYTVYYLARKNKRRSEDAVNFEVSLEVNLCKLVERINECTYRANGNYAFISTYPQPREIFGCEMGERLVQWYILWRITPILERLLSESLFSNRKGKGLDAAVGKVYDDILNVSRHYTRDAYIIQWDLQCYYPDADYTVACRQLQDVINRYYDGEDKDSLLWMTMIVIHANPQRHFFRKSDIRSWDILPSNKSLLNKPVGKGGVIGFLIWQTAMNLYLNEVDHWATDELGLNYTRYADDTIIVVQNKEAALTLLPLFRAKYTEVGCTMHPRKFYCQHVSKGLRYLGAHIKYERTYVSNRVIRKATEQIVLYNRLRNKEKELHRFISCINSYMGRIKNRNEFNTLRQLWSKVSDDWHKYLRVDWDNQKLKPKKGYKYNESIKSQFNKITNEKQNHWNGRDGSNGTAR